MSIRERIIINRIYIANIFNNLYSLFRTKRNLSDSSDILILATYGGRCPIFCMELQILSTEQTIERM